MTDRTFRLCDGVVYVDLDDEPIGKADYLQFVREVGAAVGYVLDGELLRELEIARSKLQSQGRIINHINEKNAQLARRLHTLGFIATGNPTPRIVKQIKEIRAAAGTNSVTKIVPLVEAGRRVGEIDATTPDTDWVTCGNGRTDDSMVTNSARKVVEWIRSAP